MRFLVREFGFTLHPDPREFNEFSVRFRKGALGVDVYGEGYGASADCTLWHGDVEVSVWTYASLPTRSRLRRPKGPVRTPVEQIERIAAALREHWVDFLAGDPTTLPERHTVWEEYWHSLRPTPEQIDMRPLHIAGTEAGHAFKHGEFARVVLLLSPFAAELGKKQTEMLETSLDRVRKDSD